VWITGVGWRDREREREGVEAREAVNERAGRMSQGKTREALERENETHNTAEENGRDGRREKIRGSVRD
jgi:hypothetical protein